MQIDGLARVVLERARRSGDVPTLDRWLREGTHRVTPWETGWSSQTGVSQCGILHGSVIDMPAFRWVDKSTGQIVVSNRPESAAAIERAHSDGHGLLAHHGSIEVATSVEAGSTFYVTLPRRPPRSPGVVPSSAPPIA